jgi:hypothetical protein
MERRGFLGSLLALPILAGLKPKSTESPMTIEMAEKILNTSIDDPVWQSIPCSGTFDRMSVVQASGYVYLSDEQYRASLYGRGEEMW